MTTNEFGFYFEKQGRSGNEGPIDPAQQYFEGSHADQAVVRETAQNTLDNKGTGVDGPIRMEFELKEIKTDDIPGIDGLRNHLLAAAKNTEGQQGHDRIAQAVALSNEESISVLRISDYNTTGLTGCESLKTKESPLSRLTRGTGGSNDDERGGSFGIGSAVGPMASDLCTVIYTSLPEDSDCSVLAGYTRLATHLIDGESFRAEGFYTNLNRIDDFEYQRPAPEIGSFSKRTEPGTDIYILGYRMSGRDPNLVGVRTAMISNFMAAIKNGNLIVEGITTDNSWTLNAEELGRYVKDLPEERAFYDALEYSEPVEEEIDKVGKVKLYINLDDSLDKKLHTVTMRAPLMKIDTFKHTSIPNKYAAVLICDSVEGNKYLRQLEPPQHHKWDEAREPEYGKKIVEALKGFVKKSLNKKISSEIGEEIKIEGLSRFLPINSEKGNGREGSDKVEPSPSDHEVKGESSSVKGKPQERNIDPIPPVKKLSVKVQQPAKPAGPDDIDNKIKPGKRNKKRKKRGKGQKGSGSARIPGQSIRFRSWSANNDEKGVALITLAVTAGTTERGDLTLAALGSGGEAEEKYILPILRAVSHSSEGSMELEYSGNTLKNVSLTEGKLTRIDIHLPAGERYRLGVV
ncbi:hypothetical protein [Pseudoalteromonas rubra]|uniref:hypothetical protein n=1 Tax=Pseudoalteromonas rubra TaxID=43658 RepID=UPI002DBED2B6|nr:hypothetical protein [Pseudoalteromonas rubra]MEC4088874.1 hypothetical protein [Pseudoalteromonas rubra]